MRMMLALILMTFIYSPISFGENGTPVALTQVAVVVPDRSLAVLDNGLQIAFEKQLVQMSGDSKIMSQPHIWVASKNVKQWVETYSYVEHEASPTLTLLVTFDQKALQKLLDAGKANVKEQSILDHSAIEDQKSIDVVVTHIEDMKDLSSVLTALRGIHGVTQVSPKDVQSDRATVTLTFSGDASRFENQISDDHRFSAGSKSLEYEWVGREP